MQHATSALSGTHAPDAETASATAHDAAEPSLRELDRQHLIHPVSAWRAHEQRGVTVLESGEGCTLRDSDGNELLDAFAGLWCVNVGYGQRSVVEAATRQMHKLPYATGYFSFGSEPTIRLADKLVEISPPSLRHVYFSGGGSEAVDAAFRLIVQYWNNVGRPTKKHFISLERGYHGSSSTGAGLTALPAFHRGFDLPLKTQHYLPAPNPYRSGDGHPQAVIDASVQSLRDKVAELGADQVAAFFCEPILGSGGVIIPPRGWLKAMRDAARELDILFVVDEVITGFGRTGPMFACDHEGVDPDLMTLAKGLTSGYIPMGATLLSEKVYSGIADGAPSGALIGHGATYSGHPVAAAVALEVIRIYQEGGMLQHAQSVASRFGQALDSVAAHPLVGDVRYLGLLGAVELVSDKASKRGFDPALGLADKISRIAYANKLVIRSFNDQILGFAPALCITLDECDMLGERLRRTLDEVLALDEVKAALAD
jgi:adenosylmethionine-8-amino-7-oxononanoate aminotransferase